MSNTINAQEKAYVFKDTISVKVALPKTMIVDLYNKSILYDSLILVTDTLINKVNDYEDLIEMSGNIYEKRLQNLEEQVLLSSETIQKKDTIINLLKENSDKLVKEVKKERVKRKITTFTCGSGIIIALILLIII